MWGEPLAQGRAEAGVCQKQENKCCQIQVGVPKHEPALVATADIAVQLLRVKEKIPSSRSSKLGMGLSYKA